MNAVDTTTRERRRLLLVSGSVRDGSTNAAVLSTACQLLADDWSGEIFGGLGDLPHFNPDLDDDRLPPAAAAMRETVSTADAVLFSTPEYAGTLPGSFKNLLDWTIGGSALMERPVGWINPSASPTGAAGAYATLRIVIEYTGAIIVDDACRHIPVARDQITDGIVTDEAVRSQIAEVVAALTASR